ncbi:unnamed protein product [Vitrella brassicaformis CCMP3155]|uniref:Methyltransferase domain-containing protein n=1 Tax=Vitrella brassicaformis (strain CCMP3155) TaxID=1169540 RepID=A0A0G4ESC5_VITBC|nr:unnamed protein product [Vitrella brassicaformis CCMP3155]|eukprot:CEM00581.1 unnamed protein product [Vitrella brassicaformis CCMP3155]
MTARTVVLCQMEAMLRAIMTQTGCRSRAPNLTWSTQTVKTGRTWNPGWDSQGFISPYQATSEAKLEGLMSLLDVQPSDIVADLGCGDGRVVIECVRRFKCAGWGIDLDEALIGKAVDRAKAAGVPVRPEGQPPAAGEVVMEVGNLLDTAVEERLKKTTIIFVYLLPEALEQLTDLFASLFESAALRCVVSLLWPLPKGVVGEGGGKEASRTRRDAILAKTAGRPRGPPVFCLLAFVAAMIQSHPVQSTVQIRGVVNFVLANPRIYPGPHTEPQPRTSQGLVPMDTTRQLLLIWDAFCDYLIENMEKANSVHIPNFGTFMFENIVRVNRTGVLAKDEFTLSAIEPINRTHKQAAPDGMQYADMPTYLRPDGLEARACFNVDEKLKGVLHRFPGKEEFRREHNCGSIYQQQKYMTYLNPIPIATGCYLPPQVVQSGLDALFRAILDLIERHYTLEINFKCAYLKFANRTLTYTFSKRTKAIAQSVASTRPRHGVREVKTRWTEPHLSAAMMNYIHRPNSQGMRDHRLRNSRVGVMSIDLASCLQVECIDAFKTDVTTRVQPFVVGGTKAAAAKHDKEPDGTQEDQETGDVGAGGEKQKAVTIEEGGGEKAGGGKPDEATATTAADTQQLHQGDGASPH